MCTSALSTFELRPAVLYQTSREQLGPIPAFVPVGGLLESFRQLARSHAFALDPSQERAIGALQRLSGDLVRLERRRWPWERLIVRRPWAAGIYLWGPVGRGKSFLMDEFFRLAPIARKERVHFHRFMQSVHHDLRDLQGTTDPLKSIATRVARETRLLCLD